MQNADGVEEREVIEAGFDDCCKEKGEASDAERGVDGRRKRTGASEEADYWT